MDWGVVKILDVHFSLSFYYYFQEAKVNISAWIFLLKYNEECAVFFRLFDHSNGKRVKKVMSCLCSSCDPRLAQKQRKQCVRQGKRLAKVGMVVSQTLAKETKKGIQMGDYS